MEEAAICVPTVQLTPAFCRICITVNDVDCDLYEPKNQDDGTITLHTMLGKLFPSVFSDEQAKSDESMNWPTSICQECKCKVTEAYSLYNHCLASAERLSKLLTVEQVVLNTQDCIDMKEKHTVTEAVKKVESEEDIQLPPERKENLRSSFRNSRCRKPVLKDEDSRDSFRKSIKVCKKSPKHRRKNTSKETVLKKAVHSTDESGDVQQCEMPVDVQCDEYAAGSRDEDEVHINRNSVVNSTNKEKSSKSVRSKPRQSKNTPGKKTKAVPANAESANKDPIYTDEAKNKIDLYRCQLCDGPIYTSPSELTEHLKTVHPDQIRSCEQCPKVFMSEQTFQHHQYCHAIGRSHFCIFCDKGFQTQELLKGHVRTHTHRTDYLCFLCGKEFSNSSNLRQHVKRHYGEKPWACDQCPMRFSTKGYLTRHHQTHSKIKKFTCDTCGSHFSRQYTLVKHQLIHTGARFFSCEVCKMTFTSSDHVKRHMRTHTGEKPYKCGCCGRAFAQSNDMVKHMRTHLGDNAYQCDRCDASYRLLSELRNHYKEHYQPGENATGSSSADEEKGIRFTSMNILNRRFDKNPVQYNE